MRTAAISKCPRCGERSLERFSTHDYCAHCNYHHVGNSGASYSLPRWAIEALKTVKPKSVVMELFNPSDEKLIETNL